MIQDRELSQNSCGKMLGITLLSKTTNLNTNWKRMHDSLLPDIVTDAFELLIYQQVISMLK